MTALEHDALGRLERAIQRLTMPVTILDHTDLRRRLPDEPELVTAQHVLRCSRGRSPVRFRTGRGMGTCRHVASAD